MHARNRRVVKRVTVRSMIRGPPRETNASSQWEAAELTFKNDYRWVMNTAWRWPLPSLSSVCDRRLYMQVLQQLPVQPQVQTPGPQVLLADPTPLPPLTVMAPP